MRTSTIRKTALAGAAALALLLGGCAVGPGYGPGIGYVGYGPYDGPYYGGYGPYYGDVVIGDGGYRHRAYYGGHHIYGGGFHGQGGGGRFAASHSAPASGGDTRRHSAAGAVAGTGVGAADTADRRYVRWIRR